MAAKCEWQPASDCGVLQIEKPGTTLGEQRRPYQYRAGYHDHTNRGPVRKVARLVELRAKRTTAFPLGAHDRLVAVKMFLAKTMTQACAGFRPELVPQNHKAG